MDTQTTSPEQTDVCPECGCAADWRASSWCTSCGYYPALGRLIETPPVEHQEEIYEHWWQAVPTWLSILCGGVVAVFVVSLLVRIAFPEGSVRFWWTVVQLSVGITVLSTAHLLAYLYGASRSDRIGPLDSILKPIATWQPVMRSLPEKAVLVWAGAWSLTAVVTAQIVIDGIDYQALAEARTEEQTDEPRKKKNPMAFLVKTAATVAKAQNQLGTGQEPQSLEDALAEFTGASADEPGADPLNGDDTQFPLDLPLGEMLDGSAGAPGAGADQRRARFPETSVERSQSPSSSSQPAKARPPVEIPSSTSQLPATRDTLSDSIECVIIGYTTNAQGEPRSLLLAAPIRNTLRFVAKVPLEQVSREAQVEIRERLPALHQRWPVVRSPFGGRWLRPELFCEVHFSGWTPNGRLGDPFITQVAVVTIDER